MSRIFEATSPRNVTLLFKDIMKMMMKMMIMMMLFRDILKNLEMSVDSDNLSNKRDVNWVSKVKVKVWFSKEYLMMMMLTSMMMTPC